MADFTKRSDFNPDANFTSVLFGANAPLLEIELNEMQQIAEAKRAEIIRLLTKAEGDKTAYIAEEQIAGFTSNLTTTITISKFDIFFKNQIISVPAGAYSVPFLVSLVNNDAGSYGDLYLAYKEEVANPSTTLNEDAVRNATVIANNILDTRFGTETSRRTLIKFGGIGSTVSLASAVSDGYTLLKLLKIQKVNSKLVYTPDTAIGNYKLTSYALVGSNGNPYPETSDLNSLSLVSGFHVSSASTLNKPSSDTGIALALNNELTRLTVFFTDTGRIFTRNTTLLPVFSAGTWREISPSDLDGEVRAVALTGIVFTNGTDITATDSVLTAFGKLQKQNTDNKGTSNTHIARTDNPHSTTKSHVGLGSVLNYGLATQAEAEAGTSDVKYMTPLRVKQAVVPLIPTDTSQLSKSDVYTKAQLDISLGGKANTSHAHVIGDVTGLQTSLDSKLSNTGFMPSRVMTTNVSGAPEVSAITTTKLGYLTDVTSNIQAQINTKQATLTGGASTIASDNLTINRVLVSDASGKVVVSAIDVAKLGYLNDVNSAIQSQLNGKASSSHAHPIIDVTGLQIALDSKQATITGGASSVVSANLTASRALVSDGSGKIAQSGVTATEIGYLSGVTSALQTQLNAKSEFNHNHNLNWLGDTLINENTAGEILKWNGSWWVNNTLAEAGIAPATHTHATADVTGLDTALSGKQATVTGGATTILSSNLSASRALVSDASGKVGVSAVTSTELGYLDGVTSSIQTQLSGKASTSHSHVIGDTTGLQTALDGKAPTSHTHTKAQITDFPTSLPASDVYSWAKASVKPTYTYTEVGASSSSHTHSYLPLTGGTISNGLSVTGLTTATGGLKIGSYKLTIASTAPSAPATGDIWIDI